MILTTYAQLALGVGRLQVPHLGLDAAREASNKIVHEIQFEPEETDLSEPKEGEHDDKEHSGGNTYAGGVSVLPNLLWGASLRRHRLVEEIPLVWVAVADISDYSKEEKSNRQEGR